MANVNDDCLVAQLPTSRSPNVHTERQACHQPDDYRTPDPCLDLYYTAPIRKSQWNTLIRTRIESSTDADVLYVLLAASPLRLLTLPPGSYEELLAASIVPVVEVTIVIKCHHR
ncbi:hypothetical protein E1301_Tti020927 [Triplophysa tibetana]|uniref:Uncharacterized protein n=1 Tax=Triplophysa tibetana TaxID=1572043 RepID=A0A5A9N0D5_9TELE|nr:hypothetical protein E1301_Tti020927 [Triplophysa tibetana]